MNTLEIVGFFDDKDSLSLSMAITEFPGGEVNICIPPGFYYNMDEFIHIEINCRISNSVGVMALLLLNNALLQESLKCLITLNLGYIPYGRQDRVCNKGEAFSSCVFSQLLNSLNVNKINTLDPHSAVSTKFIDNDMFINSQEDMIIRFPSLHKHYPKHPTRELIFVSPDKGAKQKTIDAAKALGIREVIQGHKVRDPKTGELTGFTYKGDVKGKHLLIVDDICDGGGTFIGLVKELWKGEPLQIDLYVSHGIFSKGVDILFESGISNIYTTDTVANGLQHPRLHVTKWY